MARRRTRKSSLVYSRYLLWLRAGLANPSFSHDRTMEADTPKRWATAPTFSASPIFLAERGVFFLRSILDGRELEDALDKGVSTWPSGRDYLLSEYSSQVRACISLTYAFRFIVRFSSIE